MNIYNTEEPTATTAVVTSTTTTTTVPSVITTASAPETSFSPGVLFRTPRNLVGEESGGDYVDPAGESGGVYVDSNGESGDLSRNLEESTELADTVWGMKIGVEREDTTLYAR